MTGPSRLVFLVAGRSWREIEDQTSECDCAAMLRGMRVHAVPGGEHSVVST